MTSLRALGFSLSLMLSTSAVIAAPVLRADITVSAPVVTVGDMFEDAGVLAEQPLFRSPLPGTTGSNENSPAISVAWRGGSLLA